MSKQTRLSTSFDPLDDDLDEFDDDPNLTNAILDNLGNADKLSELRMLLAKTGHSSDSIDDTIERLFSLLEEFRAEENEVQ